MAVKVDDIELIRSFNAGDPDAFTTVVAQYREPLMRHAMRRLNNVAAAEDAVQETFFRAYRAFERLQDDSRLGPWLHHILGNVCIDEANRRQRDTDKSQRACRDPFNSPFDRSVEEQLGLDVDDAPVRRALGSLPDTYQQALTMRFVEELTYDEIAVSAGTTEENARARVSRARSAMRVALRGVAAIPVFLIGLTRRGSRNAAALERAEHAHKVTLAADTASSVGKVAGGLAPAVESMNAVVMAAHQAGPIVTKAAIGIGAIALATLSTGPERPVVPPPADASASADADAAAPTPAVAPSSASRSGGGAPDVTSSGQQSVQRTPATSPAPSGAPGSPASGPAPVTESAAGPEAVVTAATPTTVAAPTPTTVASAPPAAPPAPAPAVNGATVRVSGLSVVPSGPRLDLSGTVDLTVAGTPYQGSLSGRLSIAPETDANGRQRLEGVATITLADGTSIELRIAGHAVLTGGATTAPATTVAPEATAPPADPATSDPSAGEPSTTVTTVSGSDLGDGNSTGQPATSEPSTTTSTPTPTTSEASTRDAEARQGASYTISGQFRLTGATSLMVAASGTFNGSLGPSSLLLDLTP